MECEDKKVRQFAMPIKFSKSKPSYNFVGKKIGTDTEEIIESLGYSRTQFEEMKNNDVFK